MHDAIPTYIYPPYPKQSSKISPRDLSRFEATGRWVAQRKFGGSRVGVRIYRKNIKLFDRHGGNLISIPLTDTMRECLLSLNLDPNTCYWLDGEFLHNKAKIASTDEQAAKDTIVLFDILYAARHLTTETQLERLDLLTKICNNPIELEPVKRRALQVVSVKGSHIWMAETFHSDFEDRFYDFYEYDDQRRDLYPEIEGVVLRNKQFRLKNTGAAKYSLSGEVIRCRKPTKTRNF